MHLPKQFSITRDRRPPFDSWGQREIGGFWVHSSPALPVTGVVRGGRIEAYILGWFVHGERFFNGDGDWSVADETALGELYGGMSGRFVVVAPEKGGLAVRTDPGALLPVVYDSSRQIAGSSPAVLARHSELSRSDEVQGSVARHDHKVWYPFGLTPWGGVNRLLPNHTLDLGQGAVRRVDHRSPVEASTALLDAIVEATVSAVAAMARKGPICAHLTAGHDSRVVLAACLAAGIMPDCITIQTAGARLDVDVARRLARLAGVEHRVLAFAPPSEEELRAWDERTGHCIVDSVRDVCRTVAMHDDGRTTLAGICGEVARGFYWTPQDVGASGLDARSLLERLGFRSTPLLMRLASEWLEGLTPREHAQRTNVLDLAYIEQRLGGWAGPSLPGHPIDKPTLSPLNQGRVFDWMRALPEEDRLSERFAPEFIARTAPRLLSLPFNRPTGISRIRFWKHSLKRHVPAGVKAWLKGRGG